MPRFLAILACAALGGCHWVLPYLSADARRDRSGVGDWPGVVERRAGDGVSVGDGGPLDLRASTDRRIDKPVSCKDLEMAGLPQVSAPALTSAMGSFNSGCKTGYTFCQLLEARAFQVPACFAGPPTLLGVLPHLLEQGDQDPQWWAQLSSASVQNTFFFNTSYSTNGPTLLQEVNKLGGAATPAGLYVESPDTCQNCTKYLATIVLLYPSRIVVRLDGNYGYDS
jgi:hypothetical protein